MLDQTTPIAADDARVSAAFSDRTVTARRELEQAVAAVRAELSDEEVQQEFGVDLARILD